MENVISSRLHINILEKCGFYVKENLGRGSFGTIKKVLCSKTDCYLAAKIIKKSDDGIPKQDMDKFLKRELTVIRVLNHPNIIKFIKTIETTKHFYIIMELAQHGDLLEMIKKTKAIDEQSACRWFHHLVDGIEYCHKKGIAHRDLKCENLLLCKYFVLKITDFGFVRHNLPITENFHNKNTYRCDTFCGSVAYASPEILGKKPYQPYLSDIWSMGIILYVMVCGRFPYDVSEPKKYRAKIRGGVKFSERPSISNCCKQFIQKILKPEQNRIYIPEIRKDPWYNNGYDSQWDEEVQKAKRLSYFEKVRKSEAINENDKLENFDD